MEGDRNGRDEFAGFRVPFAGFSTFGRPGSLMSGFFGGRDPFDDPFFSRPLRNPRIFASSSFGHSMSSYGGPTSEGVFLDQAPLRAVTRPIIRELGDEEGDMVEHGEGGSNVAQPAPIVQDPDAESSERGVQMRPRAGSGTGSGQSRSRSYAFQSVTYGGIDGAYYTASRTRRTGEDGITVEESKEADTVTGEATHRFSRGIHDKGHSVTRKLNSDGRVDTMQTLHNLDKEELAGFEKSWKDSAGHFMPGWDPRADGGAGASGSTERNQRAVWSQASPAAESVPGQAKKTRVIPIL